MCAEAVRELVGVPQVSFRETWGSAAADSGRLRGDGIIPLTRATRSDVEHRQRHHDPIVTVNVNSETANVLFPRLSIFHSISNLSLVSVRQKSSEGRMDEMVLDFG